MATITVRKLGTDGDPLWGQGQANFISDADAVAQIILTRLRLFQGEWWSDLTDGTPYWQQILGKSGSDNHIQVVTLILTQRIAATPYVNGVSNVQVSFNPSSRGMSFYCVVQTQFGPIALSNIPTPTSRSLPV